MRSRRLLLPTATLALALTGAACGDSAGGPGVASLGGTTSTTAPRGGGGGAADTGVSAEFQDAMVDFAECMRREGVDFPDPGSGQGGLIIGPGSDIDPEDPDFKAAEATCKPILDAAEATMPKPSEEEIAEMRDSMLAFARCMRDEGIDMPDPDVEPGGRAAVRLGGDPNDPEFRAASERCSEKTGGIGIGRAGGASGGGGK